MYCINSITLTKISKILDNNIFIGKEDCIAIGVSGGVDSMTLLNIASVWAKKFSKKLVVLTFNHNLRKESIKEVQLVQSISKALQVECKSFIWKEKPSRAILEKARIARYKIFSKYCKSKNINSLLIAHTADDIAETFAIRIIKKSNLDGLCPLAQQRKIFDISIVRPLLGFRKSDIYEYANYHKIKYNEDPSNKNNRFLRSRIRKYLEQENNLSTNLIRASSIFCMLRKTKDNFVKEKFKSYYTFKWEGYLKIDKNIFRVFPKFLIIDFLKKCIVQMGNREYPPKSKKLETLFTNLKTENKTNYSLAGCIISSKKEEILVIREFKKIQSLSTKIHNKTRLVWDNRFIIYNLTKKNSYTIFPLGKILEKKSTKTMIKNKVKYKNWLPFNVKKTLPVIKTLEGLVLIPHFNIYGEYKEKIRIDINDFTDKNDNYNI